MFFYYFLFFFKSLFFSLVIYKTKRIAKIFTECRNNIYWLGFTKLLSATPYIRLALTHLKGSKDFHGYYMLSWSRCSVEQMMETSTRWMANLVSKTVIPEKIFLLTSITHALQGDERYYLLVASIDQPLTLYKWKSRGGRALFVSTCLVYSISVVENITELYIR